jgi:hypothetical protein
MSNIEKSESTVPVVIPTGAYTATAQERILELRQWRDQIPYFTVPTTENSTRQLSNAASVTSEFIELTNVATANHMPLVRPASLTPDQIRDRVAYADAYSPLADELEALAKFVRFSTTSARNEAGAEALTTYSLAVRLSKRPATAYLAPYAADMRRALGRGRKSTAEARAKKAAATPPAAEPAQPVAAQLRSSNE